MKTIFSTAVISVVTVIFLSGCGSSRSVAQTTAVSTSIGYQDFYDGLSPYGTWIDYPAYGHVWHPSVTGEFRPYLTNGYWDYSNEGWLWQSNYSWGWAPFHYGRWVYDDMYGWLWIPGYEWSPAWVTWGNVDSYYGWAPLMPDVNVGIAYGLWRPAAFYWNFVGRDHIYDRDIFIRVEKREVVNNFVNRVAIINNFSSTNVHKQFYSKGPDVKEVERYTSRTIKPASIREVSSGYAAKREGSEIHVYRPVITHPQPKEFRRVDNSTSLPVRSNEDKVNNAESEQRKNVERLPIHKAPENMFRRSGQNFGGRRSNRR